MTFEELKDKALSLPFAPGVYIMRDAGNKVIYVGKAKKLKNRVSQYFQDSAAHTPKTRAMVSKIDHFDVIVAASEFEALVLECSLIKRYLPKYNILLKDDKGYPYLRLDMSEEYPRITVVHKLAHDGAAYFGPYGSWGVTQHVLHTILRTLKLPDCSKQFPRDLGKDRPCLNYHMNQCKGWCQLSRSPADYRAAMEQARLLLTGNYQKLAQELRAQMLEASEELKFEQAAELRDRLKAVEALGQKQLVTAGSMADTDVIGFAQTAAKSCFVVLHYSGGNLLDKEYEIQPYQDTPAAAVSSLVKQYYLSRGIAPKIVLLPMEMEDGDLFSDLMFQNTGRRTHFRVPQRGDNVQLVQLARENAMQEAERVTSREERISGTLQLLGKMLSLPQPPRRMESFDISNIAGTDIVASMVVFADGRPLKRDYRRFQVKTLDHADDLRAMEEVLERRFRRYLEGDEHFAPLPDLLLMDGGQLQAEAACHVLERLGLTVPVLGMVKDDRHRTRALVTPQGQELGIQQSPPLFALVGRVQEEVHRFAITYHHEKHAKSALTSRLDGIPGVGDIRKKALLRHFKSVRAIEQAELLQLEAVLPKAAARAVYDHFHKEETP